MSILERNSLIQLILSVDEAFEKKALAIYDYQYASNPIYKQFINIVRYNGFKPDNVSQIPFLPISLFKTNAIQSGKWDEVITFRSSGTTGANRSNHLVRDLGWYEKNTISIWEEHFEHPDKYDIISLLPNYHQNPHSSLLQMLSHFMNYSGNGPEDSYINDYQGLFNKIESNRKNFIQTVLFGVSFALLDYIREFQHVDVANLMVVETGGMKKYAREITRSRLHTRLKNGFKNARIISEYGMTECLSQAYSLDHERFEPNARMRIYINDASDPGSLPCINLRGRINIIDLANIDTISFIGTDDLGISDKHQRISIIGRLDHSDLRGCNYLI